MISAAHTLFKADRVLNEYATLLLFEPRLVPDSHSIG